MINSDSDLNLWNHSYLPRSFLTPAEYQPPKDDDLKDDTNYPNLNSTDYRVRAFKRRENYPPFFELIEQNEEGAVLLGANAYYDRVFNNCVYGFEKFEDIEDVNKCTYKVPSESSITTMKFVGPTVFLMTKENGLIELWSTKAPMREPDGYCLFKIGSTSGGLGYAKAIDTFEDANKAITCSTDSSIQLWDYGSSDLYSTQLIDNAHAGGVNGVSVSPKDTQTFVSCSNDRSVLLWDKRSGNPKSLALYENHTEAFTTVYWTKENENKELIVAADRCGEIYTFDSRLPKKILQRLIASNRTIKSIKYKDSKFGVISNTPTIKVYELEADEPKLIYENSEAENFVRDFCWSTTEENSFYVVGYDELYKKHSLDIIAEKLPTEETTQSIEKDTLNV